jgi:hypothetical protein
LHDFFIEQTASLRFRCSDVRLERVSVAPGTVDFVSTSNTVGRVNHRHRVIFVESKKRRIVLDPQAVNLRCAYALDAAGNANIHFVSNNLLRRHANGHESRGALPIYRHTCHFDPETGDQRGRSADIELHSLL